MPRWLVAAALCVLLVVSGAVASAQTDGVLSGYSLTSWHDGAGRPLGSVYAVVQEIAALLGLSVDTVPVHLKHVFAKLEVKDRTAAVNVGLRRGILHID